MTPTQKKWLEWPLILALIWVAQSLEISVLRLPGALGSFHIPPVVIVYLGLTRNWFQLTALAFVFAILGSATVTHSGGLYIAAQVWTALFVKTLVTSFALEGRLQFTLLVAGASIFSRVLTHVLLAYQGGNADFWTFLVYTVLGTPTAALLGWLLFPLFMEWDRYFQHEADEARELNPDKIR
jgi:hypothetical protein